MGYDLDEMKMLAAQRPKIIDKLDTNIGIRCTMRQRAAMQLISAAEIRALIVIAICKKLDG